MCLQSLRKIGKEKLILMLSLTVFLSYLPEAGEYASFFVYLRLVSLCCNYYVININRKLTFDESLTFFNNSCPRS